MAQWPCAVQVLNFNPLYGRPLPAPPASVAPGYALHPAYQVPWALAGQYLPPQPPSQEHLQQQHQQQRQQYQKQRQQYQQHPEIMPAGPLLDSAPAGSGPYLPPAAHTLDGLAQRRGLGSAVISAPALAQQNVRPVRDLDEWGRWAIDTHALERGPLPAPALLHARLPQLAFLRVRTSSQAQPATRAAALHFWVHTSF